MKLLLICRITARVAIKKHPLTRKQQGNTRREMRGPSVPSGTPGPARQTCTPDANHTHRFPGPRSPALPSLATVALGRGSSLSPNTHSQSPPCRSQLCSHCLPDASHHHPRTVSPLPHSPCYRPPTTEPSTQQVPETPQRAGMPG